MNQKTANIQRQGSFQHRMASLSFIGDWRPKCQARGCPRAVEYDCEYDMMRKGQPVTGVRIYCEEHAEGFATLHNIDISAAPSVPFNDVENSDRSLWAYEKTEGIHA